MAAYQKICVICSKNFFTRRITTAYCSKVCQNRSRSLPATMKAQLLRRNAQYAISATKYSHANIENDGRMNSDTYGKDITASDIAAVRELGLKHNEKLRKNQQLTEKDIHEWSEHHESVEVTSGEKTKIIASDTPIDIEMINFNLGSSTTYEAHRETRKMGEFEVNINFDTSLPDPNDDGFGPSNDMAREKDLQESSQIQKPQETQQTQPTQQTQQTQTKKRVFGKGIK